MFSINIPSRVKNIIKILESNGYEAYVVGGCVRDSLLGKIPNDWDITTNAKPEEIINLFEKTIPTGIKHGTITVLIDNMPFEVTTYRIDGEYSDSRHPDSVQFTEKVAEDLSRRDFTINAMAYNYQKRLVDLFGGCVDLKNKVIKCVGTPSVRFKEDALRMLRAVRFSAQLDFDIEKNTKDSILNKSMLIKEVSGERIQSEINKILVFNSNKMILLKETGLLKYILPEINDNLEDTLISTNNIESKIHLKLTMLLKNQPEEKSKEILKKLKYDNDTIKKVSILIKYSDYNIGFESKSIKIFLNKLGDVNLFRELIKVKRSDISFQELNLDKIECELNRIIEKKECFLIKDLALNGNDLISLGLKRGKEIGKVLNELLEKVIENPNLNNKEDLKKIVLKMIKL